MENIILSLLLIKSMTIYEISTFIQQNLTAVCSSSFGSIQSALKKLLGKDCISYTEYLQNNTLKKEYHIKDAGLVQFNNWIQTPVDPDKIKSMEEGKFFFLGMTNKKTRINSIEQYIKRLEGEQKKYVQIENMVNAAKDHVIEKNVERIRAEETLEKQLLEVSGEDNIEVTVRNIYNYQIYNLEYALKKLEDDIKFFSIVLDRELNDR